MQTAGDFCFTDSGNGVDFPVCEPVSCGSPPYLDNGFPLSDNAEVVFGQSVAFLCNDGFYMTGISVRLHFIVA